MNLEKLIPKLKEHGGHAYKVPKYTYRASTVGYCKRKVILEKEDAVERYPDEIKKAIEIIDEKLGPAWVGNAIHELIQQLPAIHLNFLVENTVEFSVGKITFTGHIDIEFEKKIVDIKSLYHFSKGKYPPHGIKPEKLDYHLDQLAVYQVATGKNGELWYITRSFGEHFVYEQSYLSAQERFVTRVLPRVQDMFQHEAFKTLPTIEEPYNKSHWLCANYCPFREVCYS